MMESSSARYQNRCTGSGCSCNKQLGYAAVELYLRSACFPPHRVQRGTAQDWLNAVLVDVNKAANKLPTTING